MVSLLKSRSWKVLFYYSRCLCLVYADSFTIEPNEVYDNYYSYSVVKACQDNNKLILSLFDLIHPSLGDRLISGNYSIYDFQNNVYITSPVSKNFRYQYNFNDSRIDDTFKYLKSGKYLLTLDYNPSRVAYNYNSYRKINYNRNLVSCTHIVDTLVIPPYTRPDVTEVLKGKCNSKTNIVFIPDSNLGVPPYLFEIFQGPDTFPIQASNRFELSIPGTYGMKMYDACGNATTRSFSFDTSSFLQVHINDTTCEGSNLEISLPHSSFYQYRWKKPNGTIFYGDTFRSNPFSLIDIGNYEITRFTNLGSCVDSFKFNYLVQKKKVFTQNKTIYEGDSFLFNKSYYIDSGTYIDTIARLPCDSISVLNLRVIDTTIHDTTFVNLCFGDSILFKGNFYSQSGLYIDSLNIPKKPNRKSYLFLKINPATQTKVLFPPEHCNSFVFRSKIYTTSVILLDTIRSTNQCDSIIYHINNKVFKTSYLQDQTKNYLCRSIISVINIL